MKPDWIQRRLAELQLQKKELTEKIKEELHYLKNVENINVDIILEESTVSVSQGEPTNTLSKEEYLRLKNSKADKGFLTRIISKVNNLPESNGSRYFSKINVNIGIICDEFLFNSLKDAANFYYIKKDEYKNLEVKLDVLVVASTWKGLYDDWKGFANPKNTQLRNYIYDMIDYFREQGVKIVFYSKEDPTNYDRFVDIAKKCDYIFTTAIEKINDYRRDCNNFKVYPLEFSVNPIYNNPIGYNVVDRIEGAIFAGSWYEKYPHRKKDTRILFDGVLESGKELKIIDRNFEKNLPNHFFPPEYIEYISPSIEHSTLQKIFKIFPWTINLNSIKTSETMFANRVYELQAMGRLILSNYSLGINNLFPNIFLVHNKNEIKYIMNNMDKEELYRLSMFGVRKVLREHTSFHRVNTLLKNIGINKDFIPRKKVAVIVEDKNNNEIQKNFNRQSYEDKELVTAEEIKEKYEEYDFVTFFKAPYEYGEFYLEDMINGFKYTNSSYVTKDSYMKGLEKVSGVEHNYVNEMKDKFKTVFSTQDYAVQQLLELKSNISLENGYSIDCLELNIEPVHVEEELDLKLSVIIPVYNNGEHLYGKCFASLLRSSMFKNMDIVLVDDGSTDPLTINMVDRLDRMYANVTVYKFNDGGSGSASRPRNKGIELAKTDYITFLDPDNEAVNDGYYHLFNQLMEDNSIDLVVGDIVKFDTKQTVLNYSKNAYSMNPQGIITDTYNFLKKSKMRAQSIQALIVKKNIITKNNLKMVEKAAGQDTLFFQQLILHCSKMKVTDLVIHIYYAAVSNSVTNSISKKFFEKYLILERERQKFLISTNLLETYMSQRFSNYFIGWYLSRVPKIKDEDVEDALEVLYQIFMIYRPYLTTPVEPLKVFDKCIKKKKYEKFVTYCRNYFTT